MNAGNKKRKVSNADVIAEDKKRRRKNIKLAQATTKCTIIIKRPETAPQKAAEEQKVDPETVKSTASTSDNAGGDTPPPTYETTCRDNAAVLASLPF